jgi:hypothetical protein
MSHDIYMVLIIALLFAAIFVLISGLSRMYLRSYYLEMGSLSKHFSGSCSRSIFSNPKFSGVFSGYKFTVTYVKSGGRGLSEINGLYLVCDIQSSSNLKIFAYDINPGPVLLAKRINVGDSELDKYYIYANNQDEAARFFSDPARRHSFKQIMSKWQTLEINDKRIYTYANIRTAPPLDPDMVRTTVKALIDIQVHRI